MKLVGRILSFALRLSALVSLKYHTGKKSYICSQVDGPRNAGGVLKNDERNVSLLLLERCTYTLFPSSLS